MSGGPFTQTFDTLSTSGTANPWQDNVTLTGWYASRSAAPNTVTNYRASVGSDNAGALYSFGAEGVGTLTDRALGSIGSGTVGAQALGVRLVNNTAHTLSNLVVQYTGEQWRNANNTTPHALTFSHQVSQLPLTDADASGAQTWVAAPVLNFTGPSAGAFTGPLDGNHPTNRVALSNVLAGLVIKPGEELFLRWLDPDDSGTDHGLGIDDVQGSWQPATGIPAAVPLAHRMEAAGLVLSWSDPAFALAWGTDPGSITNRMSGVTSPHTNALTGAVRFFRLTWP
jgi:hypothetical protein